MAFPEFETFFGAAQDASCEQVENLVNNFLKGREKNIMTAFNVTIRMHAFVPKSESIEEVS
jgi:hypothetical protein